MAIRKVLTKEGSQKWEVYLISNGRGSKGVRRRFDKKIDAENFVVDFKSRQGNARELKIKNFEETTFKVEADFWLSIQAKRFSPGHTKRVNAIVSELLPKYGSLTPDRLDAIVLTRLQNDLLESGLSPASVNRKTEVVVAILNFASKHKRIPFNPSVGFQKLREVREEMKFWSREEAGSFLEYANNRYLIGSENRWVYVVYLLALNTALRAGEIWGLQRHDLIENGEIIFVRRQFDRVKKAFRSPKGKKARRVPCAKEVSFEPSLAD